MYWFFFKEARNVYIYIKFPNCSMLTTKSHQKYLCVLIKTFVGEIWPITCMYWSPYLEFRLPSPLTLSTWQTCSYPVNLAQFSTTPRNRLWALLPWMCPSLSPLCYLSPLHTFLLYLFSWCTFVCLSLSSSGLWVSWGQGLSVSHLCSPDPSGEVADF